MGTIALPISHGSALAAKRGWAVFPRKEQMLNKAEFS